MNRCPTKLPTPKRRQQTDQGCRYPWGVLTTCPTPARGHTTQQHIRARAQVSPCSSQRQRPNPSAPTPNSVWASGSTATPTHVSFVTTTVHTGNHRVEPQHSARGQSRLQLAHHPTHCRAPDLMYSLRVGRQTPSPRHGNGSGDGGSRKDVRPFRIKTAAILTESPQRGAHRRAAREGMLHGRA